jgi:hypothetical protein
MVLNPIQQPQKRESSQPRRPRSLHAGGIEHRHHRIHESVFALMWQGRGLARVIVAGNGQHPAVAGGARCVGMLEHIATAIDTRPFAVPHAEYAIEAGAIEHIDLLRSPDAGGGKVFVDAGLKMNVVALEEGTCLPQRLIEGAEGRATIAGNEPGGVETGGGVALALHDGQAHQGLNTGEKNPPRFQSVLVVKGDLCKCHGHISFLCVMTAGAAHRHEGYAIALGSRRCR